MDWNTLALITYIFLLSLAMLFVTFILYSRLACKRYPGSAAGLLVGSEPADGKRKLDYQQIERVIQLHLDVKNDLANFGDVLVAIRNDSMAAQEDMQRQIDLCLEYIHNREKEKDASDSMRPEGPALRKATRKESVKRNPGMNGVNIRDQVAEMAAQGMKPDQITQKTGLSLSEVDLIINLNQVR